MVPRHHNKAFIYFFCFYLILAYQTVSASFWYQIYLKILCFSEFCVSLSRGLRCQNKVKNFAGGSRKLIFLQKKTLEFPHERAIFCCRGPRKVQMASWIVQDKMGIKQFPVWYQTQLTYALAHIACLMMVQKMKGYRGIKSERKVLFQ